MTLTPRQKEVVRGIASGLLYKEVARDLGISEQGVQRHVDRIKVALRISSIADLTRYALAKRIVKNEFLRK